MVESTLDSLLLRVNKIFFVAWTAVKTYLNGPYYSCLELNRNYQWFDLSSKGLLYDQDLQITGKVRKLGSNDGDIPSSLAGKVCLITGGSRGIGQEVVKSLLRKGCHVITGSSANEEEIDKRRNAIIEQLGDDNKGCLEIWHLDLSSMDSVMRFISKFKESLLGLNYLICNGGVMFAPFNLTTDGFESHLAVNYLSHCLIISHMVTNMAETGRQCGQKSRIVSVSSGAHRPHKMRLNDLQSERLFSTYHAYAQSKLAQIMFVYKFNEWLASRSDIGQFVTITTLHPGVCRTDLMKEFNFFNYKAVQSLPLFRSAEEGAETTLYATLSTELEGISGVYLEDCCATKSNRHSYDKKVQEKLWNMTWNLLKKWSPPDLSFHLTAECDKVQSL